MKEYCHFDAFNASCGHNQVIVMEVARYGRMKVGTCVKRNLGYLGCSMDVLRYMDSICSGQRSCKINVVDLAKKGMKPCPEDVTHYLEASYKCQEGECYSSTNFLCLKKCLYCHLKLPICHHNYVVSSLSIWLRCAR